MRIEMPEKNLKINIMRQVRLLQTKRPQISGDVEQAPRASQLGAERPWQGFWSCKGNNFGSQEGMLKSKSKILKVLASVVWWQLWRQGRRCSSCAQPLAAPADWNYCRTAWNKPRMSLAGWGRCRAFPDCLIIHMNRHTSVMKCSWNDRNDEHNHLQSFLQHQGAQQGSGTAPAMGTAPSWELLPVPLGKDRDTIPNPNNALGHSATRIKGFSNHLNL